MIFNFKEKKWWKNTNMEIQSNIENLCVKSSLLADYFNSLKIEIKKEIVRIDSLQEIGRLAVIKIEYRINNTNQVVYNEFVIDKEQNSSGGRCLISLNNGFNRQIIIYKNESMLTFFPDFSKSNLCQLPQSFVKKLNILLNNKHWTISKITDLGTIVPFAEICPIKIPIFWVDINSEVLIDQSLTDKEIKIYDYNKLTSIGSKINDSIALSIIIRKHKLDKNE